MHVPVVDFQACSVLYSRITLVILRLVDGMQRILLWQWANFSLPSLVWLWNRTTPCFDWYSKSIILVCMCECEVNAADKFTVIRVNWTNTIYWLVLLSQHHQILLTPQSRVPTCSGRFWSIFSDCHRAVNIYEFETWHFIMHFIINLLFMYATW